MSDFDQIEGNYSRGTPPTFQWIMGFRVQVIVHPHHVQCVGHPNRREESIVYIVCILLYVLSVFYSHVLIISFQ